MKATLYGGVALFIAGVAVALAQLWLEPWSAEVFVKVEFTLCALFAVMVAVWFVRKEYRDYRQQQDNPKLD